MSLLDAYDGALAAARNASPARIGYEAKIARVHEARQAISAALAEWRPIAEATVGDRFIDGPLWLAGPALIDEDYNPEGIVEGFWLDDIGWQAAVWCGYHDEWHTKTVEPTHFMQRIPPPFAVTRDQKP